MDETSREFALLNPSGVAQRQDGKRMKVADENVTDGSIEDDDEYAGSEKDESDREEEEEELRQQIRRRLQ